MSMKSAVRRQLRQMRGPGLRLRSRPIGPMRHGAAVIAADNFAKIALVVHRRLTSQRHATGATGICADQGRMMDEESIGLLGVLLIVTGVVLSHQVQRSQA